VVLFNVPATISENEISSILREGKKSLQAIPGVRNISTSRSIQPDGEYRYCLSISLASKSAIEVFQDHPAQQRFENSDLWPRVTEHLTLDLEES
jgi:fructose-bisphosphate aldolase class II